MLYALDRLIEPVVLRNGYRERPSKINATNLLISLRHTRRIALGAGFEVLDLVSSRRTGGAYGGQHGLVLRRQ